MNVQKCDLSLFLSKDKKYRVTQIEHLIDQIVPVAAINVVHKGGILLWCDSQTAKCDKERRIIGLQEGICDHVDIVSNLTKVEDSNDPSQVVGFAIFHVTWPEVQDKCDVSYENRKNDCWCPI